ncbi:MAG: glutamate synthase [Acidobacteria bacterium]|nr:glutamate synthase [Acidobacteriota bacterium]
MNAESIVASRLRLAGPLESDRPYKAEEEGGCGVVGFACDVPAAGRHIIQASEQMHNRGNGKGGGIAALGLVAEELGVSRKILDEDYLLQVALLDPACRAEVEEEFIRPFFDIHHESIVQPACNWRELRSLEVKPPDVMRYFVRVKPEVLRSFSRQFEETAGRDSEDELVYQNSFKLNQTFYASLGEKRAFVLSHARDLVVLKIVGYAEDVARYYGLEGVHAHAWIAHQRYPTKGRVWHPGGAHPFIGLNEALVHNGDFANYHSVSEYLAQRGIRPLFLTDTEVSVQLFDLWSRVYGYPLENVVEAMAPTTERDFQQLPEEKRRVYRAIQASHIHGSPDGPWFFIIARNDVKAGELQLIGVTDTSMLRPQVFALVEGAKKSFGFIASEKQAIDATLSSLATEDSTIPRVADLYWNARGGSHTDGGAFVFAVKKTAEGARLTCRDKFGKHVKTADGQVHYAPGIQVPPGAKMTAALQPHFESGDIVAAFELYRNASPGWNYESLVEFIESVAGLADGRLMFASALLTRCLDVPVPGGSKKRSSVRQLIEEKLGTMFDRLPPLGSGERLCRTAMNGGARWPAIVPPAYPESTLFVDCSMFPPEGDGGASRFIVEAYGLGWKRFVTYKWRGQRFAGCGLGPGSSGVVIDIYGSAGDYLASGADGCEIRVHGNAQDQIGQIFKDGKLVVFGDVGQTFFYGAKGGQAFIMGNAAGRPLINAVGRPRVVINGTCLDYLAESFMAGDPLNGGGFVILNGIKRNGDATIEPLDTPYPGGNLFSLASGGAIYIRDPERKLGDDQLNGGRIVEITAADWNLILPYLQENERLFDIPVAALLSGRAPEQIYRKVEAVPLGVLGFTQSYTGT